MSDTHADKLTQHDLAVKRSWERLGKKVRGGPEVSERYTIRYRPGFNFGGPLTEHGGHVEAIAEHVYAGESVDGVASDYGVDRADVLAACAHMQALDRWHRPPSRRKWARWTAWADAAYPLMAKDADPTEIPDPFSDGVR